MLRGILRGVIALCGALAGCGWFPGARMGADYGVDPMYGIYPPPPHDSTIEITDFSYTPASPIRVGDTLSLIVQTNKPTDVGDVVAYVRIGGMEVAAAPLNDSGRAPDEQAADGRWQGTLAWGNDLGTVAAADVVAYLWWADGAPHLEFAAPPLTVLPPASGSQE